ncbi:HAD-IIB family hydrolase [Candidatus Synechococcus spongiarum]|uniref:Mannosyl-3-phosphoglycerate phosphatase n=1 Tax=Candidatus Synechococcus spongiarum TaxID=431041 RepID=A0A170T549_9SYNE|nr:HAD-IIB family hydrolase [Candidatus Synechococcus spongiarum]CZB12883.1 Mannosyl-3-phosphoglycerate phosphatase [Candidatus Synechococcus spongiarum]
MNIPSSPAVASQWLVVTDLDGTLLDHAYDFSAAAPLLRVLEEQGVPVVPCTSKTAEEVEQFQAAAGLSSPYIVENGGAIHFPHPEGWLLDMPHQPSPGGGVVVPLGWPSQRLRPLLDTLAAELDTRFFALEDLSLADLTAHTGLSPEGAALAARRHWSVPFVLAEGQAIEAVEALAAARGLKVLQGNRFAHLIAPGSDKGLALEALRRADPQRRTVLALGDSPNDQALLDGADQAIVIPGADGPHPRLRPAIAAGDYQLASAPHAVGWADAVTTWLALA